MARPLGHLLGNGHAALMVAAAIVVMGLFIQLSSPINHDTAWYLHAVAAYLEGGRLYQDVFFEVNPPLAFYLTVPPVYFSRLSGSFPADTFVLYCFALIGLSLAMTSYLLGRGQALPQVQRNGVLLAALLALIICPSWDFGQREHLLLVFTLPYLALTARRAAGTSPDWRFSALVGATSALGFALKPHFLLVPAVLELSLLLSRRRLREVFRPENLSLGAVVIVYLLAILWLTPEYLERVVPYALEVYNSSFRNSFSSVALHWQAILLPMVLAVHLATRSSRGSRELPDVFCLAALGYFAVYLVQMKGWSYQIYPTTACLLLALGAILSDEVNSATRQTTRPAKAALTRWSVLGSAAMAAVIVALGLLGGGYQNAFLERLGPLVRRHAADSSILMLTTNVSAAFPLVNYTEVGWSSRFPTLWLLPGLQQRLRTGDQVLVADERERLHDIETYLVNAVVEDLTRRPPELIIVDVREEKSYFGGLAFDYVDYFTKDPRFAAIWSRYEMIDQVGHLEVFKRRAPQTQPPAQNAAPAPELKEGS